MLSLLPIIDHISVYYCNIIKINIKFIDINCSIINPTTDHER